MEHPAPSDSITPPQAMGLTVLESLRAEEEPWPVGVTFIRPPIFGQAAGSRSFILYGGPGSGKTALRKALESATDRFMIHWMPTPDPDARAKGTPGVRAELEQVFSAFAMELSAQLLKDFSRLDQSPEWVKKVTGWFLKRYLPEGFEAPDAAALLEQAEPGNAARLRSAWESGQANYLKPDTPFRTIVDHMMKSLAAMGWPGACVMVDGLEGMVEIEREALAATLEVFLSSLFLFDDARFHYKLFLPETLERDLAGCTAIERQRVSVLNLFWAEEHLKCAATRRLACATGQDAITLKDIFNHDQRLADWLMRCGGPTPRGWLEYMKPILAEYLETAARGPARPLTEKEWLTARQRSSVRLLFHADSGELIVGARRIDTLTPAELAIIRYLYGYQNKLVSKEKLYREVILPFYSDAPDAAPKSAEKIMRKDYEDSINTALWRLRKEIEPDPKRPIFLISERDKGIMLKTSAAIG